MTAKDSELAYIKSDVIFVPTAIPIGEGLADMKQLFAWSIKVE